MTHTEDTLSNNAPLLGASWLHEAQVFTHAYDAYRMINRIPKFRKLKNVIITPSANDHVQAKNQTGLSMRSTALISTSNLAEVIKNITD